MNVQGWILLSIMGITGMVEPRIAFSTLIVFAMAGQFGAWDK